MNEFLKHSSTKEHPGKYVSAKDSIRELLEDHETVIIELRTGFDDCVED